MKNLSFAIYTFFVGMLGTGCNTDPCKGIECGSQGSCTDGICSCNAGYEKDLATSACEVKWSAKFLGNYSVSDQCNGAGGQTTHNYNAQITEVDESNIAISDFNQIFIVINAAIDNNNYFQFDINTNNAAGIHFDGTGNMNTAKDSLWIDYVATYTDSTKDTCATLFVKQ